ncbi:helix-turn-helix domain-containing protein [Arenicella xantha]|uniref:Helix-turn-helix protein n=1 Tax=Arenicella xantha TaxID=644221 RepID=A0A395JGC4_9GAMM|nr:helix-turn-helix transcriptional regulator [Arenicella xantha]RBP48906.1 helix-turn-helix protein [Arenicella xantha]
MLVDAKKMKVLRQSRNWTQQHLADVCSLSMRTIQRVEKDGVASNETVAAYAAVFELDSADLLITTEQFDHHRFSGDSKSIQSPWMALIFVAGFALGVALTNWFG